jgi:hypothetical protein
MDVRHNTALLERAIELIVQRASIPFRKAEAEAAERLAQATARRRLATGAAVALAAIGIGLGVFFGLWKPRIEPERIVVSAAVPPLPERTLPQSAPQPKNEKPPSTVPNTPSAPINPHGPVFNYVKFGSQETDYMGHRWEIMAGHHYASDTDSVWADAWCYTEQDVDGVHIRIQLVVRDSPTAQPRAPIASTESLSKVGLNDSSALELAV